MNIGDKILKYRKLKGYSQEDIANSLNVSRQTVSKWETNQSTPDFNKIVPLCKLFGISADELLDDVNNEIKSDNSVKEESVADNKDNVVRKKFALLMSISIFLYFLAVIWIILGDELNISDNLNVSIFLGLCGIATVIIIYNGIVNGKGAHKEKIVEREKVSSKVKTINDILAMVTLTVYILVSFTTMAWHITWIIWVVYGCVCEIVKAIFQLGDKNV